MGLKISIIIPARNAQKTLASVFEALLLVSRKPDEILLIDDGSTDETAKIGHQYGALVLQNPQALGAGYSRNLGARNSKGDILVFLDSDVVPKENFLDIILEEINKGAGGIGGRYLIPEDRKNGTDHLVHLQEEEYWFQFGERAEVKIVYGGICAFSRKAWFSSTRSYREVKLFPAMASGEDCFVCEEISQNFQLIYRSDLIGIHHTNLTQRNFARAYAQGFSRMTNILANRGKNKSPEVIKNYGIIPLALGVFCLFLSLCLLLFQPSTALLLFFSSLSFWFYSTSSLYLKISRKKWITLTQILLIQRAGWIFGAMKAIVLPISTSIFAFYELFLSAVHFCIGREVSKLFFFVTHRCNSNCSWCLDHHRSKENLTQTMSQEISLEQIQKMIDSSNTKITYLTLTGGEPFLRDDLDQIIIAFYKGARTRFVTIVSNGFFPEKIFTALEKALILCPRLKLNIQLTVADLPERHDQIRKTRNSYERIKESSIKIQQLQKVFPNLIYSVATQLDDSNIDSGSQIIAEVKITLSPDEHFVTLIRDNPMLITKPSRALQILPKILEYVNKQYPTGKSLFQIFYNIVVQKSILEMTKIRNTRATYRPCVAGKKFATLYENGNLVVCENRQDLVGGNIKNSGYNLNSLFKSEKWKSVCNKQLQEKCQCDWGCAVTHNLMNSKKFVFASASEAVITSIISK